MQRVNAFVVLALAFGAAVQHVDAEAVTPVTKVITLLSDLQAKIIKEGETAQKEYAEYAEWCEDKSKDLQYEIKTGKAQIDELKATIAKESANIEALAAKIEELAAQIATAEADLKAATEIRGKEAASFSAEEKELVEIFSALDRAIGILNSEMAKSGASMLQLAGTSSIVQAFSAMVQASMLSSADAGRLTALVQSSRSDDSDADLDVGAPDAAVYEGHSGDIIGVLEGLKEKAESQLATARKTETQNLHNFEMLKQSLEDELKNANSELSAAKSGTASSKESKEVAIGDLDATTADNKADISTLADTHQLCMTTAQDFEAATKSRDEELKALADAKASIMEKTGGADTLSYGFGQLSFVQTGSQYKGEPRAVVRFVLDLARKQNSRSLALLASRISSAIRFSSSGQDPFGKIKGLISDMIERLENEGSADASHKAYCDKEMYETNVKKDDKTAEIEKMTTSIDKMSARKAVLQEEVATLMKELSEIAKRQAGYDQWFQEFDATLVSDKADMDAGIEGVKLALKILRDYYAKSDKSHVAAMGAGGGIIGLLEVVESDFTKGLAEMSANHANQKAAYEQTTKDNEITTTAKNQDVKYKTQEITQLTKALAETTADKSGVQTELDAVLEYLESLHKQCDEKVEPYAETKARRESEIAGLKEALSILEGEAVLFQKDTRTSLLRGVRRH
jgi:peptidoglycan hydrolase CwlO-like protein